MNRNAIIIAAIFAFLWIWPGFVYAEILPSGITTVTETKVQPYKMGGSLIGQGVATHVNSNLTSPEASTLLWRGENGGTVVQLLGSHSTVGMFGLSGQHKNGGTKAGIGLHITRPRDTGLGSGKHYIPFIAIDRCETAIQFGDNKDTKNCDECTFGSVHIEECDVGVKFVNTMAMGHTFTLVRSTATKHAFLYHAGGKTTVTSLAQTGECESVICIDSKGGIGSNNYFYDFGKIHLDQQAAATPVYEQRTHEAVQVTIGRIDIAFDHYNRRPQLKLRSPGEVIIGSFPNLQPGCIHWHSRPGEAAKLKIENTRLSDVASAFNTAESVGRLDAEVNGIKYVVFGEATE